MVKKAPMASKKRTYTQYEPSFKIKAVARFNATPLRKRSALARKLGVTYQHLYNWSKQAEEGGVAALYGKAGRRSTAKRGLTEAAPQAAELSKRQQRLIDELTATCEELRKLRENYAEREAMVLAHIKRLTGSLDRVIVSGGRP